MDYDRLYDLLEREVNWVTRSKSNMSFQGNQRLIKKPEGKILRDDMIVLTNPKSRDACPGELRRVLALRDKGKKVEMEFITNNLEWAAIYYTRLIQFTTINWS